MPKQPLREEKDVLIEARQKLNLTQQQVADKARVAMRHYQMFERGTRKLSSSSFWTASKILQALELDVTTFANGGYCMLETNEEHGHKMEGINKHMKKYKVFRSFGNLEKDIKKHTLVAVEYGTDIYAVTDTLIKAVTDDVLGIEKYQTGYTSVAYAPEPVDESRRVKRYTYSMMAVVSPVYGENDLIDYGIIEETVEGRD